MGPDATDVESWLLHLPHGVAVLSPIDDGAGQVTDFRYVYVNDAMAHELGAGGVDAVHGRLASEVHQGPHVMRAIERLAASVGKGHPDVEPVHTLFGTHDATATYIGRDLLVALRPTDDRERSRPALLQALDSLETSSDYVAIIEPVVSSSTGSAVDFRIRFVNDSTLRRVGIEREDAIGRLITEVSPNFPAPFLQGLRHVARTGVPYVGEAVVGAERFSGSLRLVATPFEGGLIVAVRDTSAELQTRAALAHSEALFRATVEALQQGIFVASPVRDHDGEVVDLRIELVNQAALDIIRMSREEITGRTVFELFPSFAPAALASCLEVLRTGRPLQHDAVSLDGKRKFEARIARSVDGIVGAVQDVTERWHAAERLVESERRYRLLADHAADVVLLSRNGTSEWVAPSIEQLVGYTPEEFVAIPLMDWVHPDDLPVVVGAALSLAQTGGAHTRLRARHRDGSYIWVEIVLRLIPEYDELGDAVVATVWNIDAQVEAEQELQRAEQARRAQEERVQQASRLESLGVMAGGIAHDFNNLLVGVLGNAEMALHSLARAQTTESLDPVPAAVERLGNVVLAAQRAGELTRQLLDYAGRRPRGREPVDVGELVAEVPGLVGPRLGARIEVDVDVVGGPVVVVGDRGQLQQVLMNLVINAGDAIGDRPGHVQVRLSTRPGAADGLADAVEVTGAAAAGLYAVIEVSDDGVGIDPDVLGRIFEPFFTKRADGRGLGLAVAHGIVRSHGGRIAVASEVGVGTTMTVLLPITAAVTVAPEGGDQRPAPGPAQPAPPPFNTTPRVLVIDDDPVVADVSALVLRTGSLDVEVEIDPRRAIERFRAAPATYSAVLLDLAMPTMRGDRVLVELREIDPDVPVVVVSGYSDASVDGSLDRLGVSGFVRKPYRSGELLTAVITVLRPTPSDG